MLSVTGVDKGDMVSIIKCIVYGSRASVQKLTSNTELTMSHNVKNVLQHTALNITLRQSRVLLAESGNTSLRNTVILSEAISYRKTAVPSKANPLIASENPDLDRLNRRGEHAIRHSHVNDAIRRLLVT